MSKKSLSMRLKTQSTVLMMPSLTNEPVIENSPRRLKSGFAQMPSGITAVPGMNEVLL